VLVRRGGSIAHHSHRGAGPKGRCSLRTSGVGEWHRAVHLSASARGFLYQAASWKTARRVVAKVEFHVGGLFRRVGFIVTNLSLPSRAVARFYNKRDTASRSAYPATQNGHSTGGNSCQHHVEISNEHGRN